MKPLRSYLLLFGGLWLAGGLLSPQCSSATAEATTAAAVTASVPTATDTVLAKAPVVARKIFDLGDHKVTLLRIRKPNLPRLPVCPAQVLSAADQAAIARRETKAYESFSLFATVYPGIGTELAVKTEDVEVYAANKAKIVAAYTKHIAAEAARDRQMREHPPKPADTTIHFLPVRSTANPR